MLKKLAVIFAAVALVMSHAPAFACTNFTVKAEDGTVVIARSNEFPINANSQIVFEPAGRKITSKAPGDKDGKSWTSRYAFLGINGMGLKENFVDGMNEAGLSMEGLLFAEGKYETPGAGDTANAVSSNDLVSWVLGNFATCGEVKEALSSVKVWGEYVAVFGGPLMLHFAIHDASGKCLVVEFIDGEKKVYDNPVGTMTNMPDFPWQVTHLRSYLNFNVFNPKPKDFNGLAVSPTGQGAGWLGMPGDWSPPSRFVRVAYLSNVTSPAKDRMEALNLARHILNTVDIPVGIIDENMKDASGAEALVKEYTQWSLLLDLTNRVMYYYTYDDMNLKCIDMKKMAQDGTKAVKFIPMSDGFSAADKTDEMAQMKL
jgi:choloylglycine hydrolase